MGCLHSTAAREYPGHENPVKLASETACKFNLHHTFHLLLLCSIMSKSMSLKIALLSLRPGLWIVANSTYLFWPKQSQNYLLFILCLICNFVHSISTSFLDHPLHSLVLCSIYFSCTIQLNLDHSNLKKRLFTILYCYILLFLLNWLDLND